MATEKQLEEITFLQQRITSLKGKIDLQIKKEKKIISDLETYLTVQTDLEDWRMVSIASRDIARHYAKISALEWVLEQL